MTRSGSDRLEHAPTGRTLHPGDGRGAVLRLDAPLSFWGGVDTAGRVVDPHHPQCGQSLVGRVVAMPGGRGSSSSAAVLAERLRAGSAPAALVLGECDTILVVGALIAAELYGVHLPIVQLPAADLAWLGRLDGGVEVHADDAGAAVRPVRQPVAGS